MYKIRKTGRNILSHVYFYFYAVWVTTVSVVLSLFYILQSAGELSKITMPRLHSISIKSESVGWDPGTTGIQ